MILIRYDKGNWHAPEASAVLNERYMQDLLKMSPSLLPGATSIAMVDEFPVPGIGSLDLLGVSTSGEITIVECKLKKNPEIRREVVGQVLAYAGGLWRMTYDDFAASFSRRSGDSKTLMSEVCGLGDYPVDEDDFREEVTRRLDAGEFRLIIAVDEITPELKLIVQYLNEHTLPTVQVLATELAYAREGRFELLIPSVYGEESAERRGPGRSGVRWNAVTLAEQVEALPERAVRECVELLQKYGEDRGYCPHYGSGLTPSCSYKHDLGGEARSVWAISLNYPTPQVRLSVEMINKWSHHAAVRFLDDLKKCEPLAGVLGSFDESDLNKWPVIPVDPVLLDLGALSALMNALDRLVGSSQVERS